MPPVHACRAALLRGSGGLPRPIASMAAWRSRAVSASYPTSLYLRSACHELFPFPPKGARGRFACGESLIFARVQAFVGVEAALEDEPGRDDAGEPLLVAREDVH